jgi:flagellar biosynthesis protein FlhF
MKTKTFRAPHMMAALETIQTELGPDAMILSVRQVSDGSSWKLWRRQGVEVVALGPEEKPTQALGDGASQAKKTPAEPNVTGVDEKNISDLINRIASQLDQPRYARVGEQLAQKPAGNLLNNQTSPFMAAAPGEPSPARVIKSSAQPAPTVRFDSLPATLQKAHRQFCAQGLDEELVNKVIGICVDSLPPSTLQDSNQVKRNLSKQLEVSLRTRPVKHDRVVCLIGSSGSGKTSTAAKLAVQAAHHNHQKVVWVCADTVRAGAISESRAFTDSLGISLQVVYTPAELEAFVAADKSADLILVDMPSCNPYNERSLIEMGDFLTVLPARATYWVVSATARTCDLKQSLAAYSQFNLDGLILTKMDETRTFGDFINLAWRCKLPIVYFTTGMRVVEDFKPANPAELVSALFI